jgi:hypothetical protein
MNKSIDDRGRDARLARGLALFASWVRAGERIEEPSPIFRFETGQCDDGTFDTTLSDQAGGFEGAAGAGPERDEKCRDNEASRPLRNHPPHSRILA